MAYPEDWLQETTFGFGYPDEGATYTSEAERTRMEAIARVCAANAAALGVGIYSGGDGSLSGGALAITAAVAIVQDADGWVPVTASATTIAATEFPAGISYVHLQASETAREDGGCGYYVSASATPATGAVLVCKCTKVGSAITAVDNSVRAAPAVCGRIPWAVLVQEYGETETLGEVIAALQADVAALEAAGLGGGELPPYWGAMTEEFAGVTKRIRQGAAEEAATVAEAAVDAHVAALHGSSSSGGATATVAAEQWDVVAVNELRIAAATAHYLPTVPETLQDAAVVVDGHCGAAFVDTVNSTF